MQITVRSLIEYLDEYPADAPLKFAITERNGDMIVVANFGFIRGDKDEVVIHPYFGSTESRTVPD